jgi:hypothetical protein
LAKKLLEIFEPVPPDNARQALQSIVHHAGLDKEDSERIARHVDRYDPKIEVAAVAREVHRLRLPDARSFLATLLEQVGMPSLERSEIMASLRLYTPLNQLVVHCPFKGCGKLSEPGLLFCPEHLHEAAMLDAERARNHGPIRSCAFKGANLDGSIGCSIIFRSLTSDLCAAHQPPPPPPPGPGATVHVLPLSNAPRRSTKKKKPTRR